MSCDLVEMAPEKPLAGLGVLTDVETMHYQTKLMSNYLIWLRGICMDPEKPLVGLPVTM